MGCLLGAFAQQLRLGPLAWSLEKVVQERRDGGFCRMLLFHRGSVPSPKRHLLGKRLWQPFFCFLLLIPPPHDVQLLRPSIVHFDQLHRSLEGHQVKHAKTLFFPDVAGIEGSEEEGLAFELAANTRSSFGHSDVQRIFGNRSRNLHTFRV